MRRTEVTVLAYLRLDPEFIEQGMRDLLKFARTVKRTEKACTAIEIVQDLDEPHKVTMIERWSDRAAYEGPHLQTKHMKAFIEQSSRYFDGPARVAFGQATVIGEDDRLSAAPYGR